MRPVGIWGMILLSAKVLAATPLVSQHIPADVAWVALLERPGEVLREVGAKLDPFKSLNPDFDWAKLGAKLQAATGQNLLTAEGLSAFGIDPNGSHAAFGQGFEEEPVVVIALLDTAKFLESLKAGLGRQEPKIEIAEEKPIGPAQVFKAGNTFVVIKGTICLLVPEREPKAIQAIINASLGKGKKLAQNPTFVAALTGLGIDAALAFYTPMAALSKQWVKNQDERAKADPKAARDLRRVRDRFAGFLKQFEALSAALRTEPGGLKLGMFLKLVPTGQKALAKILPASAPPDSHQGLARSAIAAGFLSVRVLPLLEWLSGIPVSETETLEERLKETQKEFREKYGLDLMKDVLGNLREPAAAYWLTPDLTGLKAEAPTKDQLQSLFKALVHLRLEKPAPFEKLIATAEEAQKAQGLALEVAVVDGTKVRTLRQNPDLSIDFALAGNNLLLGVGQNTVASALKSVSSAAEGAAEGALRGASFFDFAAFNEVVTGAIQKGIGGQDAIQFRMMWPMVQQVLGRFTKIESELLLQKEGVQATVSIGIR